MERYPGMQQDEFGCRQKLQLIVRAHFGELGQPIVLQGAPRRKESLGVFAEAYSDRSACIGEIELPLYAGTNAAQRADNAIVAPAVARTIGSNWLSP
jgi:hypothetical protein